MRRKERWSRGGDPSLFDQAKSLRLFDPGESGTADKAEERQFDCDQIEDLEPVDRDETAAPHAGQPEDVAAAWERFHQRNEDPGCSERSERQRLSR